MRQIGSYEVVDDGEGGKVWCGGFEGEKGPEETDFLDFPASAYEFGDRLLIMSRDGRNRT